MEILVPLRSTIFNSSSNQKARQGTSKTNFKRDRDEQDMLTRNFSFDPRSIHGTGMDTDTSWRNRIHTRPADRYHSNQNGIFKQCSYFCEQLCPSVKTLIYLTYKPNKSPVLRKPYKCIVMFPGFLGLIGAISR